MTHPLRTAKLLKDYPELGEDYRLRDRHTGRTTIQCLKVIAEAMENPGVPIVFNDHMGPKVTPHMADMLNHMIAKLAFSHLTIKRDQYKRYTLTFG